MQDQDEIRKLLNLSNSDLIELTNFTNKKIKTSKPNSKKQFLNYGITQTIIALWSNFPKLKNSKGEEVKDLNKLKILTELQKLEALLYEKGQAALTANFKAVEILEIVESWERIEKLTVIIPYKNKSALIEKYEYDSKTGKYKYSPYYYESSPVTSQKVFTDRDAEVFGLPSKNQEVDKLPYFVFYNNTLKIGDIALVDEHQFQLLNRDMETLFFDSLLSAPWIYIPEEDDISKRILEGFDDLQNRFIKVNQQVASFNNALNILQPQSTAPVLLQKIKENISTIKRFMFLKTDTTDIGTKNIHNIEAQTLNSEYEDFLESKANIRELQLLEYLNLFWSNYDIQDVMVFGSTKWLIQEAKKYTVDMNGAIINPANINNIPSSEELNETQNLEG
ncbi:hypothetical protein [Mycoplasmopsis meleagridis]|uniref:hypothetical protein n=1 Tax=Mycoplasmopsis meleagridis TaxID=29561 RepID=UPI00073DAD15|nr:hypothetical protein [Mycoplasmopsis meleagridis]KUH47516.1 hypothetical protein ASB56_00045 [Mycoplasmopsis meleagridis]